MRRIVLGVVAVAGLLGASVALASNPAAAALKVIVVRTDTVAGIYTVSWQTRLGCDPGISTSGATGTMSETVVDEPVEFALVVNDICEYELSATFRNTAGATCRIAPGSLQISNDKVNLAVEANSCTTTVTSQVITIRTDTVAGSYWVSWQTRYGCDPGVSTSGASGSMWRVVAGQPVEIPLVINDTCEYDLSAAFENFAGETCRIAPSSLRISNGEVNLVVEPNSCTNTSPPDTGTPTETGAPTGTRQVIIVRTDTVAGVYTVSWQARHGCDPGVGTSGATGLMSWTVVDEPVEFALVVNDICEFDLSAAFLNAAGATCRIAPSSLRIINDKVNLAVEPNSCTSSSTPDEPTDEALALEIDDSAGSANPLDARFDFVTSTDGDRVIASWSPPSSGGGSTITGYTLTISRPGRIFGPYHLSASDRRFAVRNPRADTTYTMRVVAENALGSGLEATTSVTTPPAGLPSSPRNVSAAAHGVRQIRVTWSPPSDSASATISHYLVRYSRPAIGDIPPWQSRLYRTTGTSHTSPNLRFGTTYTVAVTAVDHVDRASTPSTTAATTASAIP